MQLKKTYREWKVILESQQYPEYIPHSAAAPTEVVPTRRGSGVLFCRGLWIVWLCSRVLHGCLSPHLSIHSYALFIKKHKYFLPWFLLKEILYGIYVWYSIQKNVQKWVWHCHLLLPPVSSGITPLASSKTSLQLACQDRGLLCSMCNIRATPRHEYQNDYPYQSAAYLARRPLHPFADLGLSEAKTNVLTLPSPSRCKAKQVLKHSV